MANPTKIKALVETFQRRAAREGGDSDWRELLYGSIAQKRGVDPRRALAASGRCPYIPHGTRAFEGPAWRGGVQPLSARVSNGASAALTAVAGSSSRATRHQRELEGLQARAQSLAVRRCSVVSALSAASSSGAGGSGWSADSAASAEWGTAAPAPAVQPKPTLSPIVSSPRVEDGTPTSSPTAASAADDYAFPASRLSRVRALLGISGEAAAAPATAASTMGAAVAAALQASKPGGAGGASGPPAEGGGGVASCDVEHTGFQCDGCGVVPIVGVRHSRLDEDFDLCGACWQRLTREEQGVFHRARASIST
jgi:hypothetical protein